MARALQSEPALQVDGALSADELEDMFTDLSERIDAKVASKHGAAKVAFVMRTHAWFMRLNRVLTVQRHMKCFIGFVFIAAAGWKIFLSCVYPNIFYNYIDPCAYLIRKWRNMHPLPVPPCSPRRDRGVYRGSVRRIRQ